VVPDLLALLSAFCTAGQPTTGNGKRVLRRRPRNFGEAEREREQSQAGAKAENQKEQAKARKFLGANNVQRCTGALVGALMGALMGVLMGA
jgi:hypothetical protein